MNLVCPVDYGFYFEVGGLHFSVDAVCRQTDWCFYLIPEQYMLNNALTMYSNIMSSYNQE